jgi:hypothetical protein
MAPQPSDDQGIRPDDRLYPLLQVRHLPWIDRPNGRLIGPRTVWRWKLQGLGGVRLRTTKVGGVVYTCDRWVREFFDREEPKSGVKPASPTERARRERRIERECEAMGI